MTDGRRKENIMTFETVHAGYGNKIDSSLAKTATTASASDPGMFFTEKLLRCAIKTADDPNHTAAKRSSTDSKSTNGIGSKPANNAGSKPANNASPKPANNASPKPTADTPAYKTGTNTAADAPADNESLKTPDEFSFLDYHNFFQDKINEIYEKIQNGEAEPSYQIGSQSFTEKEWDNFLKKFDEVEDTIRELMREEHAKRAEKRLKQQQAEADGLENLLLAESTSCSYPSADPKKDDVQYITWYTKEGIYCRRAGSTEEYEWSISFADEDQYDKVMDFISQFPSDWNMRFAAHENFWTDFLENDIDIESFMEFMNRTDHGVPNYMITADDGSMYVDKDKMQWAKYLNPFGNHFYTREEFLKKLEAEIAANRSKLDAEK